MKFFQFILTAATIINASFAYIVPRSIGYQNQVAVFWGQGSGQESLGTYCKMKNSDIVVISFLNNFNKNAIGFDFGNACQKGGPCPQIEKDIAYCQSLGIKVLLSLGGDARSGNYDVANADEGTAVAQLIYDTFHPKGKAQNKPFGASKIDGFDFDIEKSIASGLGALAGQLRKLWGDQLLISATPQCPFPDAGVDELLRDKSAKVDLVFVQFYNNPGCSIKSPNNGFTNSWKSWKDFVTSPDSGNANMKIHVGVCTSCNSEYILEIDDVDKLTSDQRKDSVFNGFALWQVSTAVKKVTNNVDYVTGLKNILKGAPPIKAVARVGDSIKQQIDY